MSNVSEPQLGEGLTSVASLSAMVDGSPPLPGLIIPDLNVAAYVCDYLIEEGTNQLIVSLLLCSSVHLCCPCYSS